jgi:ketosteroid isomerase-like protein
MPQALHDTLALAREVLDALGRRDLERMIELSDPGVEWHSFFAELRVGGVYRGHDGLKQYVRDLADAFELATAEVDDAVAVGDVAVLVGHIHVRGKESGVDARAPAGWMLKFRDGRVLMFRAFREPDKALAGLGAD